MLIVDDEASIRALIKEVLEMDGHSCAEAEDGTQALEMIRSGSYKLVIMDRHMPKMTGLQAVELLRANPKFCDLKLLMCTSASIVKEVEEAFTAGANDYVLKPLNLKQLTGKVRQLVAS